MPQFETVEDHRHVAPGHAGTLIPSWNTGYPLRAEANATAPATGTVRPGQKLHVLAAENRHLRVRQEAEGIEGWLPGHVVAPWPEP
ncbi:MAG TPA: SH3 domain-containing protein [Candidatus Dormibacteraeota bacterium]|jgi:hypothetical protein|nr:SH3 domain-containing protein [Candidatus Dormibacteraeota bacterium]